MGTEVTESFVTQMREFRVWKNYWFNYDNEDELIRKFVQFQEMKEKAALYDALQSD